MAGDDDYGIVHKRVTEMLEQQNLDPTAFENADRQHTLCIAMPAIHAICLSQGRWNSFLFPLAQGRTAGGLGLFEVRA